MIPVTPQPEPAQFAERVRLPGQQFLQATPKPTSQQWKKNAYWRKILPDLRAGYGGICAYSAHWIPHATGNHSVDHFIPKSHAPQLAYEWSNYRYVSARFNSRKGTQTILDPFTLAPDWFILDFGSFFIKPNPKLSPDEAAEVNQTIDCLQLNRDQDLVNERAQWFILYRDGVIPFSHLKERVPFIAYELSRQGLDSL